MAGFFNHIITHCFGAGRQVMEWTGVLIKSFHYQTGALMVVPTSPAYKMLDDDGNYKYSRQITGTPISDEAAPTTLSDARWFKTDGETELAGYVKFTGDDTTTFSIIPYYKEEDGEITDGTTITGLTHMRSIYVVGLRKRWVCLRMVDIVSTATAADIRMGGNFTG